MNMEYEAPRKTKYEYTNCRLNSAAPVIDLETQQQITG